MIDSKLIYIYCLGVSKNSPYVMSSHSLEFPKASQLEVFISFG